MKDKKVRDSQVLPTAQVNQPNPETAEKTNRDKLTGKGQKDKIHAGQNVKDAMPGVSRRKFMSGATTLAVLGSTGVLELLAPTTAEAIERGPFVATPQTRVNQFVTIRNNATTEDANIEITQFPHRDNGDDELYPNRLGSFSKTLQHNDLGEVDQPSYNALLHAIDTGTPADFCAVPLAPGARLKMANPLGGLPFNIEGPDSPDTSVLPPPPFASARMASQVGELYWMAICRDVPFTQYATNPLTVAAANDLNTFTDFTYPRDPALLRVTPAVLFRSNYPGALAGPLTSQFLIQDFRFDGILIKAKTRVPQPVLNYTLPDPLQTDPTDKNFTGVDFLTFQGEWVDAQRGFVANAPGMQRFLDDGAIPDPHELPRYITTARDMGQNSAQDIIYSAYFRAMLIINGLAGLFQGIPNPVMSPHNPYNIPCALGGLADNQTGFATFGLGHLTNLIGAVEKAERHSWYEKWNVHRHLRPEAMAGRVHVMRSGQATYPINREIFEPPTGNSTVLPKILQYNQINNTRRGVNLGAGSWLLPQISPAGSPSHPSFTAGHAITAGACVTLLKAWFNENFVLTTPTPGGAPAMQPKVPIVTGDPRQDGQDVVNFTENVQFTLGGELNKLAHNLSIGRNMLGVHWRADDFEGNLQGESLAIRILCEARFTYPETFEGFSFTTFDGVSLTGVGSPKGPTCTQIFQQLNTARGR